MTEGDLTNLEIHRWLKRLEAALEALTKRVRRLELVSVAYIVLATGTGSTIGTLIGNSVNGGS